MVEVESERTVNDVEIVNPDDHMSFPEDTIVKIVIDEHGNKFFVTISDGHFMTIDDPLFGPTLFFG